MNRKEAVMEAYTRGYKNGWRDATSEAVAAADNEAELIKHTEHNDGFGMGCQLMERGCARVAAKLRRLLAPTPSP